MEKHVHTAKERYAELESKREPFLRRARACAKLTIPSLIPESGRYDADFETPYQSLAARGVNNLASKLMLTLLPPNAPFFRMVVDKSRLSPEEAEDKQLAAEVERGLAKIERTFVEEIATTPDRVVLFEAVKHLLVGGNGLLYADPKANMRCFHLDQYVVLRDASGNALEIVTKETLAPATLPERARACLRSDENAQQDGKKKSEKNIDLYTHIIREGTRWRVYQEIEGKVVPKSQGFYPLDACPWIPMRLIRVDGEDYGRSYVEEYFGDIKSLDGLSQAIVEGSAAAAKVLFMLNPNSTVRERDLAEAPNLGFITGNRGDVSVLQLEKYADFRVARETMLGIEQRLAHAFILNSAIQRNGERVTAEEIRALIEDLEAALGGVYSLLAIEFQLPYVKCKLNQLQKKGRLPALPKEIVKPAIVTGVEALGRGNDKVKLQEFTQTVAQTLGPQALQLIRQDTLITRLCTAMGIDSDGLIVSEEERTAAKQEDQMQQNIQALGPEAIRMAGRMMTEGGTPLG